MEEGGQGIPHQTEADQAVFALAEPGQTRNQGIEKAHRTHNELVQCPCTLMGSCNDLL